MDMNVHIPRNKSKRKTMKNRAIIGKQNERLHNQTTRNKQKRENVIDLKRQTALLPISENENVSPDSMLVVGKRSIPRGQTAKQKRANILELKRQTALVPYSPVPDFPYSPISEPLPASQPFSRRKVAEWIAHKNERAPISSIQMSVVIFGHGGLVTEHVNFFNVPQFVNKTFQLPRGVLRTNVLGLRYAGLSNIGNRKYEETIDNYLTHRRDNIPKFLQYLDNYYQNALNDLKYDSNGNVVYDSSGNVVYTFESEIMKNNQLEYNLFKTKKIRLKGNHFGIRANYDTKRVQKYYTGRMPKYIDSQQKKIPEEHPKNRHRELTLNGPLVKIFSIEINGKNRLPNGYFVLVEPVPTGVTLTEIIEQSLQTILPQQLIDEKKTIVNVIDLTCNFTELSNPTVEFIGAP